MLKHLSLKPIISYLGKLHTQLEKKYLFYQKWHQDPDSQRAHYGIATVVITSFLVLIIYLISISTTQAFADQKIWDSKANFDSGTISNLDTTTSPGHLTLNSTTNNLTEDLTTTDNYDEGNSTNVSWDTTANKLQLAGGDEGVVTDLTDKLKGAWGGKESINATAFDPDNDRVYYSVGHGFGYYDGEDFTDLTSELPSTWISSYNITSVVYDSVNNLIYLGGSSGRFAKYDDDGTPGSKFTELRDEISSFWSGGDLIYDMVFDSTNHLLYLAGNTGELAKYDEDGTLGSKATDLRSEISSFWGTTAIYFLAYDSTNDLIYLGGRAGKFAKYDEGGTPGSKATDLVSEISPFWDSGNDIEGLIYNTVSNLLYLGGEEGEFAKYDEGGTPGSKATDISSEVPWGTGSYWDTIKSLTYDHANNLILMGSLCGGLAKYDEDGTPGSKATDLRSEISSFWPQDYSGNGYILNLLYDSTNDLIYLGGRAGKFAKYDEDGTPGSKATNLSSEIVANLSTYPAYSSVYNPDENLIYLGGCAGKFAKYDPETEILTDLSDESLSYAGMERSVYSMVYNPTNHLIYIGYQIGLFAKYDEDGTPGSRMTGLNSEINFWNTANLYSLTYDPTNDLIYLAGSDGKFAKYDENGTPGSKGVDLRSEISSFWSTHKLYSLAHDPTNDLIYLGGLYGEFAKYDDSGTPGSKATDLSSEIAVWGTGEYDSIMAIVVDSVNNLIYLGGGGNGHFGRYNENGTPGSKLEDLTATLNFGGYHIDAFQFLGSNLFIAGGKCAKDQSVNSDGAQFFQWDGESGTDYSSVVQPIFGSSSSEILSISQVSNTTYLFGNVTNGAFASFELGYKSSGSALTSTLDSVDNNLLSATLTATDTTPDDTSITYYLSADGGSHWEEVSSGVGHNFTNAGSDLRAKATLSTSDNAVTPEVTELDIDYTSLDNYTGSINLTFDASDTVNFYSLDHSASIPDGSSLSYKVRTAETEGELATADWGDSFTSLSHSLTSETTDNQFIELQADFTSAEGLATPDIDSITLDYIDNDYPETDNLTAIYSTDGSKDLTISYGLKDTDTNTNPTNAGQVDVSYQYSDDNGDTWHDFTNGAIGGDKGLTNVSQSAFTAKIAVVELSTDFDQDFTGQFKVRLTANDNELARNITTDTSTALTVDTKKPTGLSFKITGGNTTPNTVNLANITATDDSDLDQMIISTQENFANADWQDYSTTVTGFSAQPEQTIYLKVKDAYGNISSQDEVEVPVQVQNILLEDLSNTASDVYRLVVGWDPLTSDSVAGYAIYRKVDNGSYSSLTSVSGKTSSGYVDSNVTQSHTYSYLVYAQDNEENVGIASTVVSGKPAFVPTISNVKVDKITSSKVAISWTTDVDCDSFIEFGTNKSYGAIQGSSDTTTSHQFTVTGLNPETKFQFRARSRDQKSTLAVSANGNFTTSATVVDPVDESTKKAKISNVQVSDVDFNSAIVSWDTTVVTKSEFQYGIGGKLSKSIADQSTNFTTKHTVKVDNLTQGKKYTYRVVGEDLISNKYASDNYQFSTMSLPKISNVQLGKATSFGTTVSWTTNTPTNSYVLFGTSADELDKSQGRDDESTTDHSLTIDTLKPATQYYLKVKSTDNYGNSAYSDVLELKTIIDTKAPTIDDLRSDSSIITDETGQTTVQVIVSWTTDEPATSKIKYNEGVASGDHYSQSTPEEKALTQSHIIVLTDFKPSTTYHLMVVSKDGSGNIGNSKDYTVITSRQEKSLLQLVIRTLEDTFAWLKNFSLFNF